MPGPRYDPSVYDAAYFARRKSKGPGLLIRKAVRWSAASFAEHLLQEGYKLEAK